MKFQIKILLLFIVIISDLGFACGEYRCANGATYPIHLTFDDGPDLKNTRKILEILRNDNIKATFFPVAEDVEKSKNKQAILDDIIKEGHNLGSHSYKHVHHSTLSQRELLWQISNSKKILGPWLTKPNLFRLPYGDGWEGAFTLNPSRSKQVMSAVKSSGFLHIGWDSMPFDWEKKIQRKPGILKLLSKDICDKHGGIVVLHDTQVNTADNLKEWIKTLKCVGHTFVPLEGVRRMTTRDSERHVEEDSAHESLPQ